MVTITGNLMRWGAQFLVTEKFPNYKIKPIHKKPSDEAIEASDQIKKKLYKKQNGLDDLTEPPEDWLDRMQLPFEKFDGAPNRVILHGDFAPFALHFCPFANLYLTLFFYRLSFRKWSKKEKLPAGQLPTVPSSRTPTLKPLVGNSEGHTGLTDKGEEKFDEHLAAVKIARADKAKHKFEKEHLALMKGILDIKCSNYGEELKRRKASEPTAGIAQDKPEDKEWDPRSLYSDDDEDESDDDST